MVTEKIQLEINGIEFDAEVEFEFVRGEEPVIHLLPEDCTPGSDNEWNFEKLTINTSNSVHGTRSPHDVSFLIDQLSEDIINQLMDAINERT